MTVTYEDLRNGVRVATKSGGWTKYFLFNCSEREPSPGKRGVKTPFPSDNFKLTTDEHQREVRRLVESAGYDFYIAD